MYTSKDIEEERKEGWFIEDETEQNCPICGSIRISKINTYQVWTEQNISSGKILNKSNTLTPFNRVFHCYKCRKCEWQSINFDE